MTIPKIIYQSWHTRDLHPNVSSVIDHFLELNPDYDYCLFTDEDMDCFVNENFSGSIADCYNRINVMTCKVDFWRYLVLYKNGGVYLDIDSDISKSLDGLIQENDEAILTLESNMNYFVQWALIFNAGHPILKRVIDMIVENIQSEIHAHDIWELTGPFVFTKAIQSVHNEMYGTVIDTQSMNPGTNVSYQNEGGPRYRIYGVDYSGFFRFNHDQTQFLRTPDKPHWRIEQQTKPILKPVEKRSPLHVEVETYSPEIDTDYDNTFSNMNVDMCVGGSITLPNHVPNRTYFVSRNPPFIMNDSEQVINQLKRDFSFSDKIFKRHKLQYANHILRIVRMNTQVPERISFYELNTYSTYIMAFNRWSANYFHFITECLPNILFINKHTTHFPIICNSAYFLEPLIRFMGVDNRIHYGYPQYMDVLLRQPYVECGNPSPEKIQLLREVIEPKLANQHRTPSFGVFIVRREQLRSFVDSTTIFQMLKSWRPDLNWVIFDTQPLNECVHIFSNASVIVGAHGAGLTNMIFSPKNTTVVELMPSNVPNLCYWHLSEMLRFKHHIIACESTEEGQIHITNMSDVYEKLKSIDFQ